MRDDNRIKLHFMNPSSWSQVNSGYARGFAFFNGKQYPSPSLAKLFDSQNSFPNFVSLLRQLNGFFIGFRATNDSVTLAVDHMRTMPLYYAILGKDAFISDDAYWVQEQVQDDTPDQLSMIEFLLTRIVSGSDTLSPSVKQVQAGEAVELVVTSEGVRKESCRFYEFDHAHPTEQSVEELTVRFDKCLKAAFHRLAQFAEGRTVVVPLGGGLDSRLIVLMLKETGHDAIVSFTYGRPGNQESRMSRRVAAELHIPWHFITYNNQAWRDWYNSSQWTEYSKYASGLSSTPHLQDWPAVWELKMKRLIPDDSVFVPGHGPNDIRERLPAEWWKMDKISTDELTNGICEAYCTIQDWQRQSNIIQRELLEKAKSILQPPSTLTPNQAIAYFDRWLWESTLTKFVINSVRVYEFWGYQWWLPLCDLEFIRVWGSLPFQLRLKKRFERAYVRGLENKRTGKTPITDTSGHVFGPIIVRALSRLRLRKFVRRQRARFEYRHHHFAWYGLIPEDDYYRSFHGQENINTYLANQTFKRIFPQRKIPEGLDFLANSPEHQD